jgi:hypothetical protein
MCSLPIHNENDFLNVNCIESLFELIHRGIKQDGKIGFEDFSYKEAKGIDLAISDHLSTELLQFVLNGGRGKSI